MQTASTRGGSSISARTRTPSLRLHRLAELLTKSIASESGAVGIDALPLVALNGNQIVVNPRSILKRFLLQKDFAETFAPGQDSGFICDMELPPIGTTARVGGRLLPGSEAQVTKAIDHLHEGISEAIATALGNRSVGELCFDSIELGLEQIAGSADETLLLGERDAVMVPVQFAGESRRAEERSRDIARVFTAIETVNGADCLDAFLDNIASKLRRGQMDEDTIDAILKNVREQRKLEGSQVSRFFNFLDDEALARVRLQVSMRLMEAIAEHASALFSKYVQRVTRCYEQFGGPEGEALPLDVTSVYGQVGRVDLAEQLRKATFYSCLSVWPEWSAQLFETRAKSEMGFQTVREVSYRFRVNGRSPLTGENAFDSRLEMLREHLDPEKPLASRLPWSLAQLVFLHLAIPFEDGGNDDVMEESKRIAAELKRNPTATVNRLLESLRTRSFVVKKLADELVRMMKEKSRRIVETTAKRIDHFTVSVNRDVVNWDAVASMASAKTEILVKQEGREQNVAWFAQLVISDAAIVPGSIASYTVQTELKERSLALAGEPREVSLKRELAAVHMPIRLVPYTWDKSAGNWVQNGPRLGLLDGGRGVEVQYDLRLLKLERSKDGEKERTEQFRSVTAVAFALIVYIALWQLIKLAQTQVGDRPLTATLVRLQPEGREVEDEDGSAAVYTISQALEKALSREVPVKLQGLVTGDEAAANMRWRKRGAVHALLGGQPLVFPMEGSLQKVSLVNYVTRPCDTHPSYSDAGGYLFLARTYQAVRGSDAAVLKLDRMQSRYVEHKKAFGTPHLILEELARLGNSGFEHVLLLSHHFGNRHIGRAAERHAPHGTREFLDGALARYPDMHIYTLRRDVFPAMRLRNRESGESGFEVTQYGDHQTMYQDLKTIDLRSLMPVYTFATMTTPDERGRPQSGFCTYFFDVEERMSDARVAARIQANILGTGPEGPRILESLISTLRAVHFMESEKPAVKGLWIPVLDPFSWMTPSATREAGELVVMRRRSKGSVLLSFPALLSHVTKILHKEAE
jgi:hypothetical protein